VTYSEDAFTALSAANAFFGLVSGNDSTDAINGLAPAQNWGGGWTLAAKDNVGSSDDEKKSALGLSFALDAGPVGTAGHWTLSATGLDDQNAIQMDMLAVLKSSNEYAMYYFKEVAFDGSGGGGWVSPAVNGNDQAQALSHMSIYVRPSDMANASAAGISGGQLIGPAGAVPEPGSLMLVGAALMALAAANRMRQFKVEARGGIGHSQAV
jgi:hypothetical protein